MTTNLLAAFDSLVVSYSGGKDSTACLIWALKQKKPIRAVFADTGNEPPETPDYLRYMEQTLGIRIETYQREGHTFFDIVRRRGMWPMPGRCRVSSTVKRDDFAWYLNQTKTGKELVILGQRASESRRRAKLPVFTLVTTGRYPVYRPILSWTIEEVFEYLAHHGIKAHPAYAKGRNRVGCIWCVHSSLAERVLDEELYPVRCQRLRMLRREIGLASVPEGARQERMFSWPVCQYEAVMCE